MLGDLSLCILTDIRNVCMVDNCDCGQNSIAYFCDASCVIQVPLFIGDDPRKGAINPESEHPRFGSSEGLDEYLLVIYWY